jgi:hypothetical protein
VNIILSFDLLFLSEECCIRSRILWFWETTLSQRDWIVLLHHQALCLFPMISQGVKAGKFGLAEDDLV